MTTAMRVAKAVVQIGKDVFLGRAKGIVVPIGMGSVYLSPREFGTGSLGWYGNGKAIVDVDGVPLNCQVGFTITVIGSKPVA